ncbi:MAG: DUF3800 domain-containing protein [Rhodospirillales bacterium]|nr:DUF3800 domain-containing protein [Rhodospirillales bacterium]
MYLCYIDESGTSDVPGNTSHFVLAGVSVPIWRWRAADQEISHILGRYGLRNEELHTAWLLRPYLEQRRIADFQQLSYVARRSAVERERNAHLLRLQQTNQRKTYRQIKKNCAHTHPYIHLTHQERKSLVGDVADCISNWGFARLFAECIDKIHFDSNRAGRTVDEQAFEQIVSRFEQYLANTDETGGQRNYGLLVHDNNETIARKHTEFMRQFHRQGTLWTRIERIIETPLFVDSSLTRMVQVADLCGYALRRYVENGEADLFRRIFARADRSRNVVVGVRHFTNLSCTCEICRAHRVS